MVSAYPCKSTSLSEVISKVHKWMDTFEMNPKAIWADMGFHHLHDMQAFYRMHKTKRLSTGTHTPWPNRAETGVRLFKQFLSALVDTASKNLDQTALAQITPDQLMRKAATLRYAQATLSGKTSVELGIGGRPRDLMDPAVMNPEQLTFTSTKQDLLNEEIQKSMCGSNVDTRELLPSQLSVAAWFQGMFPPRFAFVTSSNSHGLSVAAAWCAFARCIAIRLVDASFDDVNDAVEQDTSFADPSLDKHISELFGTYCEAGAVPSREITSLEGRTAAMRRRAAATSGPAVIEHIARLAQNAPGLLHAAPPGVVASALVEQTARRTARQRATAAADGATARADAETAEHRKRADAVAGTIIDASLPAATDASVPRDPQRALRRIRFQTSCDAPHAGAALGPLPHLGCFRRWSFVAVPRGTGRRHFVQRVAPVATPHCHELLREGRWCTSRVRNVFCTACHKHGSQPLPRKAPPFFIFVHVALVHFVVSGTQLPPRNCVGRPHWY